MSKSLNKLDDLKIDRGDQPSVDYAHRSKKRYWLFTGIAGIVVLAYVLLTIVLGSAVPVKIATVATAYPSQAYALLYATGYVVPQTKADVASKATGRLEWMVVEEGSRVKQGEIIARLENQDVSATMEEARANVMVAQARLKEAQAELTDARLEFKRTKNLIKLNFVSKELHDAAAARYRKATAAIEVAKAAIVAAQASHEGAKVAVDYTLIRAPFDGVVLSKHADIGDVVAPFSSTTESKGAVVSMADLDTLEVEADVSESNLLKVSVGQPCEIQLDAMPDSRFRCVVNRIVPTVDRSKATVLVKVRFVEKHSRILPDMSAKVAFLSRALTPEEEEPVTVVHAAAIVSYEGRPSAFVVNSETVRIVTVESSGKIGDMLVVNKGLNVGDRVVLNPLPKLKDGSKVSVQPI